MLMSCEHCVLCECEIFENLNKSLKRFLWHRIYFKYSWIESCWLCSNQVNEYKCKRTNIKRKIIIDSSLIFFSVLKLKRTKRNRPLASNGARSVWKLFARVLNGRKMLPTHLHANAVELDKITNSNTVIKRLTWIIISSSSLTIYISPSSLNLTHIFI